MLLALALSCATAAPPASVPDGFWAHWGDGKAELSGYRLVQPRYGAPREGTAVLIFVTEDFSWSERVKADPGQHPDADVRKVLKLNAMRDFQTGIYPYHVMTSVFARVDAGDGMPAFAPLKIAFGAQEWCGVVYEETVTQAKAATLTTHTYFDSDNGPPRDLRTPPDLVYGDALPLVVRGFGGPAVEPGATVKVPWLASHLSRRLGHVGAEIGKAEISRGSAPEPLTVPAGTFTVEKWTVAPEGEPATTWWVEAAAPRRIVAWEGADGERAELRGSERLPYWELNKPGDESWRARIGL